MISSNKGSETAKIESFPIISILEAKDVSFASLQQSEANWVIKHIPRDLKRMHEYFSGTFARFIRFFIWLNTGMKLEIKYKITAKPRKIFINKEYSVAYFLIITEIDATSKIAIITFKELI